MNLEVCEPTDFSSGDHLHLGRKAAHNKNDNPISGHHTESSSSEGPIKSKSSSSKADKRPNIYVIEISDESTPENSDTSVRGPFSDSSVRRAFIRKVFLLLTAQLLITGAIISVFLFWKQLKVWVLLNPLFIYLLFPLFFVVLFVLACCEDVRRQVPGNYILLGLFTILQGLLLGAISVFYNAEEVLWAIAATALVTLALTLFAVQTKWDFTLLNGVLFVFFFILLIYGIVLIFVRSYWLHLLYAALGTVLFSLEFFISVTGNVMFQLIRMYLVRHFLVSIFICLVPVILLALKKYLVMDVQMMVGGRHIHSQLDPEEYVFAALNIYLDIIYLFLFILQLIGLGR